MKKVAREFSGNRKKQETETKRVLSAKLAKEIAEFEAAGGRVETVGLGVSGQKKALFPYVVKE